MALRRVKISRFADLNDPFELLAVDLADPRYRRAFREVRDELNQSTGLICFTKSWENPVLWGHYAEKHAGVALGFEVPDHIPIQAIYAKRPTKIPINASTGRPVLEEPLMKRLLRTKFWDWKYEDEWRVFVQLDHSTKESGLYFYDFSNELRLEEVILGPRCALPIDRVRSMVADFSPTVVVRKARIAFQTFRVVEDKLASKRADVA